ncbi:hypothetical protein M413DRAFT_443557 [Hebeloma cylindrosporum]|uniref:Proteasome assembly chaperone 1 n=1 Tax=Hebeloma cylindrosporum TaxID=76867 RepID=A0A0C3C460_HEBCY|nr:hypothetical protein M413DRAFT_443557 [Hebeloma cylindrosporum h7]
MDIDPLSDTVPPRYAIESDEEEDEDNPLRVKPSASDVAPKIEVKILGNIATGSNLVIASGDAGKIWAKGANLGEQTATVAVNGVQIGLVFNPSWTEATVIISEVLSRLPIYAMHPYAKAILDALKPSRVALLDSYPVPTYATDVPINFHQAPLRFLSISGDAHFLEKDAKLFAPPNLLQSTSASFLSILNISESNGTVILIPSPHIPQPAPRQIAPSNISHLTYDDDVEWDSQLINKAQNLLFQSIGEETKQTWVPLANQTKDKLPKRNTEIGEGGMYI